VPLTKHSTEERMCGLRKYVKYIRCGAKCWDESQWGFPFYGVENELLLRIICHTERLKPFQITRTEVLSFRLGVLLVAFYG